MYVITTPLQDRDSASRLCQALAAASSDLPSRKLLLPISHRFQSTCGVLNPFHLTALRHLKMVDLAKDKMFKVEELASHNRQGDLWIAVDGKGENTIFIR